MSPRSYFLYTPLLSDGAVGSVAIERFFFIVSFLLIKFSLLMKLALSSLSDHLVKELKVNLTTMKLHALM